MISLAHDQLWNIQAAEYLLNVIMLQLEIVYFHTNDVHFTFYIDRTFLRNSSCKSYFRWSLPVFKTDIKKATTESLGKYKGRSDPWFGPFLMVTRRVVVKPIRKLKTMIRRPCFNHFEVRMNRTLSQYLYFAYSAFFISKNIKHWSTYMAVMYHRLLNGLKDPNDCPKTS